MTLWQSKIHVGLEFLVILNEKEGKSGKKSSVESRTYFKYQQQRISILQFLASPKLYSIPFSKMCTHLEASLFKASADLRTCVFAFCLVRLSKSKCFGSIMPLSVFRVLFQSIKVPSRLAWISNVRFKMLNL